MPALAPRLERPMPNRPTPGTSRPNGAPRSEPFHSAAEAWFWTMAALTARHDGARDAARAGRVPRPCEPDDVIRCLDALYRARRITLAEARVLRVWGDRQIAPNPASMAERAEAALWRAALERLEWPLRVKGIVGRGGP